MIAGLRGEFPLHRTAFRTPLHMYTSCRSIGWFLEALVPLCIFGKEPARLTLTGVTNDENDLSVDVLKNVTLPLLSHVSGIG
jgi:RNA 3'-terminal phosphate cyclase-like protein